MPSLIPTLLAAALALATIPLTRAQPAHNAEGAMQVVSPEVSADGRATFRLYSPNAKNVILSGDFSTEGTNRPMTQDSHGVWSVTMGPYPPGIYGYYFRQDGLRIPDPGNLFISSSTEFLKSYVEITDGQPHFWSARDEPHGELHEVWYKNPALGLRRVCVYTPPGYNPAATYPAVYLLHSTTDNETFWSRVGRANFIVDNLIADGRTKPVLLVMPFGHTSVPRGPEEGAGGKDLYDVAVIGRDLTEYVMPLVEKEFHAGKKPKDRAIFGMAMGGYQAITIGLNHPGLFGYVTASSANFRPAMDLTNNFQPLQSGLAAARSNLKYVGMMTGTGESANIPQSQRVAEYLTAHGIRNEWTTPTGGTHTWQTWRGYFKELMERKFFVTDPYATAPIDAQQ
jgi:enterochelin esterase family protein